MISIKNDSIGLGPALFLQVGSNIEKVVVREESARLEKLQQGILETIRYFKGDPESRPDREIVEATDLSKAFFDREFDPSTTEKMTAEYLEDLPKQRERLLRDAHEIRQLSLSIEAGLLDDPKCPAAESAMVLIARLRQWDGPF